MDTQDCIYSIGSLIIHSKTNIVSLHMHHIAVLQSK